MVYTDSNTKKATGIICDLCGNISKSKFSYYSVKMDMVMVDSERQQTGPVDIDRRNLDLDLCLECVEKIKAQVIKVSSTITERIDKEKWTTSTSQHQSPNRPTTGSK